MDSCASSSELLLAFNFVNTVVAWSSVSNCREDARADETISFTQKSCLKTARKVC